MKGILSTTYAPCSKAKATLLLAEEAHIVPKSLVTTQLVCFVNGG